MKMVYNFFKAQKPAKSIGISYFVKMIENFHLHGKHLPELLTFFRFSDKLYKNNKYDI